MFRTLVGPMSLDPLFEVFGLAKVVGIVRAS